MLAFACLIYPALIPSWVIEGEFENEIILFNDKLSEEIQLSVYTE